MEEKDAATSSTNENNSNDITNKKVETNESNTTSKPKNIFNINQLSNINEMYLNFESWRIIFALFIFTCFI